MKAEIILILLLLGVAIASPIVSHPLDEEILTAAADGNRGRIKRLLARGANVNARDRNQPDRFYRGIRYTRYRDETPLFKAVSNEDIKTIRLLLKRGAKINLQDAWGDTPLLTACILENTEIVKLLLDAGANPNLQTKRGYSPVLVAAGHKDLKIMKLLLSRGGRLDVSTVKGITPLMVASWWAGPMLPFLLLKSVTVNAQTKKGKTALTYAVQSSQIRNVRLLLAAGANPNLKGKDNAGPLYYGILYGVNNRPPQEVRWLMVQLLFQGGAKIDKEIDRLYWRTAREYYQYQPEKFRLFIQKGTEPGRKILEFLEAAARANDLKMIKYLLQLGANLEVRDIYGMTVLDRLKAGRPKVGINTFFKKIPPPNAGTIFLLKKMPPQNAFSKVKAALESGDTKALARHIRSGKTSVRSLLRLIDIYGPVRLKFKDNKATLRSIEFVLKLYRRRGGRLKPVIVRRVLGLAGGNRGMRKRIRKLILANKAPAMGDWEIGIYHNICAFPEILRGWKIKEALKKDPKSFKSIVYSAAQCRRNNSALRYLIRLGVPLSYKSGSGLFSVVRNKETEAILVKHGAPINTHTGGKAWFCGYKKYYDLSGNLFKLYLKHGADINCPPYRKKLLRAVRIKDTETERILRGAGVKVPELELVRALWNKAQLSTFKKIHQAGAPIYEDLIFEAIKQNRRDLLSYFLKNYVSRRKTALLHKLFKLKFHEQINKNSVGPGQDSLWDYLLLELKFFPDPRNGDYYRQTPLMLAVLDNDLPLIRQLLKGGADVNARGRMYMYYKRKTPLPRNLQNPQNPKNPRSDDKMFRIRTLLNYAKEKKNNELIKLLKSYGAR